MILPIELQTHTVQPRSVSAFEVLQKPVALDFIACTLREAEGKLGVVSGYRRIIELQRA